MLISGQRVVILGGSSGVGLAAAKALAASGASVLITGRDPQKLQEAVSQAGLTTAAKGFGSEGRV